ncbi:hypothetical protein CN689_14240 [Peribacillus butanolivorans]|uniref:AP2 domain-containing protein n=1 Tax=Peribacillus butanolivorans TaxID=421767 RepID=A0AAX0S069_9BACI|nr:hypothetical protein [Peribacillus butanolivorans]PEJ32285.1 hypothetical protein CN689_14240 [Peribacillus butanolivorans]
MGKTDRNKIIIVGDLVYITMLGKYSDRVAITDVKSFIKHKIDGYRWFCTKTGYVYTCVDGKIIFMHRLITGFADEHTDHIRNTDNKIKDKLDNRFDNLRPCSNQQNQQNSRMRIDNTSLFKGVSLDKAIYKVQTRIKGKKYYLGGFNINKFENALELSGYAYDVAADYLYGEFAEHNNVKENGLLSDEDMKMVEEVVHSKIEKHGLPKYQAVHKIELTNTYTGSIEIEEAN